MLILLLEGTIVPISVKTKARTSFHYSTRDKGLFIDHISGCNYVIKAYLAIVCHALSRRRNEHGYDVIRLLKTEEFFNLVPRARARERIPGTRWEFFFRGGGQIGVHDGYI